MESNIEFKSQSDDISELMPSFIKAQSQFPPLIDNKKIGGRGGYADLPTVLRTIRPVLNANDIALVQYEDLRDGKIILVTKLIHKSSQWIASVHLLTPKEKIPTNGSMTSDQSYGSHLSYQKRYSIQNICGISDGDDDLDENLNKPNNIPNDTTKEEATSLDKLEYIIRRISSKTEKGIEFRTNFLSKRGLTDIDPSTPTNLVNEMYNTLVKLQKDWEEKKKLEAK
jgi:hypothetical protein